MIAREIGIFQFSKIAAILNDIAQMEKIPAGQRAETEGHGTA
jgi:hypothetical protein